MDANTKMLFSVKETAEMFHKTTDWVYDRLRDGIFIKIGTEITRQSIIDAGGAQFLPDAVVLPPTPNPTPVEQASASTGAVDKRLINEPTLRQQADDAKARSELLKYTRLEQEEQGLRDKPEELDARETTLKERSEALDEREQKLNIREDGLKPKETALFKMKNDIEVQYKTNTREMDVREQEIAKREAEIQKVGDYKAQLAQLLLDLQEASHNIDVQKELARQYVSRFCGYAIVFSQKSLRRGAYEYFQLLGEGLSAEQWCEVAVQNMSEAHPDWGDYIGYTYFECVAPLPDGVNIQEMKKLLLDQIERKVKTKILFVRQG